MRAWETGDGKLAVHDLHQVKHYRLKRGPVCLHKVAANDLLPRTCALARILCFVSLCVLSTRIHAVDMCPACHLEASSRAMQRVTSTRTRTLVGHRQLLLTPAALDANGQVPAHHGRVPKVRDDEPSPQCPWCVGLLSCCHALQGC